jgi:cysteine desulfurase
MSLNNPWIYLDNGSVTRPSGEVVSKMLPYFTEKWGSPVQPHPFGQSVVPAIEDALKQIYALLGATAEDCVLVTSSSAEAVSQAFLSTYEELTLKQGKNHFVAAGLDDASISVSLEKMALQGCPVTKLKWNKKGMITPESIVEAISPRTALLAICYANGLTGVVQPIQEIAEICALRGVRLLVDASDALGKVYFDLAHTPISYLAFSGSKLHGPPGTGGLYIRKGIKASSLIPGGTEQGGLRGGSINVPGIVGLGEASRQALEARDYVCTEVARLKYHFEQEVKRRIPIAKVLFEDEMRLPHVSCIAFPGVVNEALLYLLGRKSIAATMGGGSTVQISYILEECGLPFLEFNSALSFCLSRETVEEELDRAAAGIEAAVNRLLKASGELTHGF